MRSIAIPLRSSAESSVVSIATSVAASIPNEKSRRVLRSITGSIATSVAASVPNEENRRVLCMIARHVRLSTPTEKIDSAGL